jgi:hypothetical protein
MWQRGLPSSLRSACADVKAHSCCLVLVLVLLGHVTAAHHSTTTNRRWSLCASSNITGRGT